MANQVRKNAATQLRKFFKGQNITIFCAKSDDELIFVEHKKDSTVTEKEMKSIEKQLNAKFKGRPVRVEVRKDWF